MDILKRLKHKLGIKPDDISQDEELAIYLEDAENAILVFLNIQSMDSIFVSKQVELAKIYYQRDHEAKGIKSESYTEGPVSESTTYTDVSEYDKNADAVLNSLKRYRRPYVRHKEKDTE